METSEDSSDAFNMLFRPRLLLQGGVEYLFTWVFTRPWWKVILSCAPFALLVCTAAGLVTYGAWLGRPHLVERYSEWVDEELPDVMQNLSEEQSTDAASDSQPNDENGADNESNAENDAASDKPDAEVGEEEVSEYGEMLLRRLLQLENSNSRATYLVAAQLNRGGRTEQSRQMMRRIAPEGGGGFIAAHVWLAVDQLVHKRDGGIDIEILTADLSMAQKWHHTSSQLLSTYADLLESQGKFDEGYEVLAQASKRYPALRIKMANFASRHGQEKRLDRVSEEVKDEIRQRMETKTATAEDLAHLANVFLLEKRPEKARTVAEMGLQKEPDSQRLLRLLSESYRLEYTMTTELTGDNAKVNLSLLDAALRVDPTNPGVGVEIARLIAAGQESSPELNSALELQLASGQATALTHILLANGSLQKGQLSEAIPHLEIALRQAPNSPLVMNNLALALARSKPETLERALSLSTKAVQFNRASAEYNDTLGEIRSLSGDKLGAVESYEAAIGIDGTRIDTRTRLAKLYQELGMEAMAEVQESEIAKLIAKLKE